MTAATTPTTPLPTSVIARESEHVLQVYKRNPVVFQRGRGCYLYDAQGRGYLDLVSGVGVAALGHAHPRLAEAIADQATTLLHTSNLYFHPLQGELASRLADLSGLPRAFFCNSGAEAVEACLKFARRYWHTRQEARAGFVAFDHSFHGRTIGALSVTWDDHYRAPFAPLLGDVQFVSPNDPASLARAVTESTAAVILEPLQGEGGVRPFSPGMADASNDRASSSGSPPTTISGSPASSLPSLGSRTPNTMAILSASRRRATNASVCAEARSSHCASSTRHTSGSASAASASRLRTARATRKRSGASPSCIPNATRSASRWGPGKPSSPSSIGAHS